MESNYIVKWTHGENPRYKWFIRGIREDGTFYGEISRLDGSRETQINMAGHLSEGARRELEHLVARIRSTQQAAFVETWIGLLAEGHVQSPTILVRYAPGGGKPSGADALFLHVIDLLTPYVEPFYREEHRNGDEAC